MPKINPQNIEENLPSYRGFFESLKDLSGIGMSLPVFVSGVNRKLNTGNFESLDIMGGLTIPIAALPDNLEEFQRAVSAASELGFSLVSEEVGQRYEALKAIQRGERHKQ